MYHINEDKRQKSSAKKIKEGLGRCLAVKHMSEISVSDIASASGVSRSSFYRSFDTPIDVLAYACDTMIEQLHEDYAGISMEDRDEFVLFSLKYWRQHSDILEAAVNCDRLDIVRRSIERHSDKFITLEMGMLFKNFSANELDYIKMGAVGLLSNILLVWIRHGKTESPEELFELYRKFHRFAESKA